MIKKRVLIIGASSSIGCEIIRQIGDENTVILAHYHSGKERLDVIQSEIKATIVPVQADLSTEVGATSLVRSAISLYEYPDKIIFLAAPALTLTRFKDLKWNDFSDQMNMQLTTAFIILQSFLPKMAAVKYGKVVFMLSSYTIGIPPSAMAHYVTAKYAMLGLMKSLSAEYAGKQICINAVSPSMIETGFLSQIPEKIVEFTAQQHPQKRNALPSDVVPVIKFLLSDEAGFVTGINIPVTGGA
jgi:3-oxoacyl-[acyl-carrier protein] reductase